jgi:hypothetical protein
MSINLTVSCRDFIRRFKKFRVSKAYWATLEAEYEQENLTTTVILMDGLLDLKCKQRYISEFNLYVARLQSMGGLLP